jgi:FtsP/CotA-like multicopper oxidase with cupredoxin domain
MSRNQRLALLGAAVVVAVVAIVIASSSGDDNGGGGGAPTTTSAGQPPVERIEIAGNEVKGGPRTIKVTKGDAVRIVVTADKPNTIHLHGYDIEREAAPGKPARFAFTADIEGVFEIESHTFEHAGLEPAVAKLEVEPS